MYQVMDNGVVRNATEAELREIEERAEQAAAPIVPQVITCGQGREALYNAGLFGNVQPAIDAIEDADTKWRIQNAWDYRPAWERQSPFVVAMAGILGLDEDALNQLFITAAML
jgi:hypothetical protein